MSNSRVRVGSVDDLAKIRNIMTQHAKDQIQVSHISEKAKAQLTKPLQKQIDDTPKWIERNKDDLVMAQMRGTDWDDMNFKGQEDCVELWKKKNMGWDDRALVYRALSNNKSGTTWGYINNIIASINTVIIPPEPGKGIGIQEDEYYDIVYPRAATILWWSILYGVTAVHSVKWYWIINTPSIKQGVILEKDELLDDLDKHSFGISTFLLTALAIVVVVVRFT